MELFPEFNNNKTSQHRLEILPLAERLRPVTIQEFVGQNHILGQDKPLKCLLDQRELFSMILWGPPGSGKTTLARLISKTTQANFLEYSAVLSGIKQIKEVIIHAEMQLRSSNTPTILFVDEIHRFNKAQQDAFLPHVEKGTIILIGATTENPSFEVISALLSRCRVFTLEQLKEEDIEVIVNRALAWKDRGIGHLNPIMDQDAIKLLSRLSGGDARMALGTLEFAVKMLQPDMNNQRMVTREIILQALQKKPMTYDKSGEQHYNLISAFHKSLRGSDPDAAIYWLARMLGGGEDPLYILRRMIRFASEDIGLADPRALSIAIAARDSFHFLGSPEGDLALAHAAIYLATAPKSNRVDKAFKAAKNAAQETCHCPVPMHLRNAPTKLMKDLGYGKGYQYDHDFDHAVSTQYFLPEAIKDFQFYHPGQMGFEIEILKRIQWWQRRKNELRGEKN